MATEDPEITASYGQDSIRYIAIHVENSPMQDLHFDTSRLDAVNVENLASLKLLKSVSLSTLLPIF